MKIRMQDNSIRLRLTRGEVDEVQREGLVRRTVSFSGGASLDYSLESSSVSGAAAARYTDDGIVVSIPQSLVREWATTEQVSIAASQPLGPDSALAILVEKDFECLTPRQGEDESDMFPHPLKDR